MTEPVPSPFRRHGPSTILVVVVIVAVLAAAFFALDAWRTHARLDDARADLQQAARASRGRTDSARELRRTVRSLRNELTAARESTADAQLIVASLRAQRSQALVLFEQATSVADELGRCAQALTRARELLDLVAQGKAFDPGQLGAFDRSLSAVCIPATDRLRELAAARADQVPELSADPAPPTTSTVPSR